MDKKHQDDDIYSEQETAQRFEKIVRAALNTPPKPMKNIPRQRPYKPRKRKAQTQQQKPGQ
jgi:hypothetical protein